MAPLSAMFADGAHVERDLSGAPGAAGLALFALLDQADNEPARNQPGTAAAPPRRSRAGTTVSWETRVTSNKLRPAGQPAARAGRPTERADSRLDLIPGSGRVTKGTLPGRLKEHDEGSQGCVGEYRC